jgi:hypothetical protein
MDTVHKGDDDDDDDDDNNNSNNNNNNNNNNLQLLPGNPSATELQKITLMSIGSIICKVLG